MEQRLGSVDGARLSLAVTYKDMNLEWQAALLPSNFLRLYTQAQLGWVMEGTEIRHLLSAIESEEPSKGCTQRSDPGLDREGLWCSERSWFCRASAIPILSG